MSDLKAEAEALGIEVDGRWGEKKLAEEISKAKAEQAPPSPVVEAPKPAEPEVILAPVKLLYDTWGENELRMKAGTIVELPAPQARALINTGKAERADPLPGEVI